MQDLFVFKKIAAERSLDEADVNVEKPLSPIMTRLFNSDLTDVEAKIQDATEKLNTYVADINDSAQSIVNEILDDIVNKMIPFGYPKGVEEMGGVIAVYEECIKQGKTWEDLLDFHPPEDVIL